MKSIAYIIIGLLGLSMALTNCSVNSNLMLKTHKEYVFDSIPSAQTSEQYTIAPNDIIKFRLYANKGFLVIDLSAGTGVEQGGANTTGRASFIEYLVRDDSTARLPMVGNMPLAGKTILEAELFLQEEYAKYYNDPYVQIEVINQRVIVFPGNGATARVVNLTNTNTTLLEVIALAGGIPDRGRARRIKLIRNVDDERNVYLLDLSTIDGLKHIDMVMQANDIVYVEPVPNIAGEVVKDVAPIVSLISSAWVIYVTFRNLR